MLCNGDVAANGVGADSGSYSDSGTYSVSGADSDSGSYQDAGSSGATGATGYISQSGSPGASENRVLCSAVLGRPLCASSAVETTAKIETTTPFAFWTTPSYEDVLADLGLGVRKYALKMCLADYKGTMTTTVVTWQRNATEQYAFP